jgi:predicted amidohydrolase
MTANRNAKRAVRARSARTGESYTAALHRLRSAAPERTAGGVPGHRRLRLAVAQLTVPEDPRSSDGLRAGGVAIRRLMQEARSAGARVVHFPEGATCVPHKQILSTGGPDRMGPADWDRLRWPVLRAELARTAEAARELGLWTVVGSVHRLTPPNRPYNSLYVISDRGAVVARYDERMLSPTKIGYLYSPGSVPVTVDVDGVRFGCALGIEARFPELFLDYERRDVDCVLFSTHGPGTAVNDGPLALQARAHAAANCYWVSYAGTAQDAVNAPSGVVSPQGDWLARCPREAVPGLAVADLDLDAADTPRPWLRTARGGRYDQHLVHGDPRSDQQADF